MEKVLSQEEINALFSAMSSGDWSRDNPPEKDGPGIANRDLRRGSGDAERIAELGKPVVANRDIDLLMDIGLPVSVSFGNSEMQLKDILKLEAGSVIELDQSVHDPVTILVNRKPIATGEVVVLDGNYSVRILEVESATDRVRSLK
jgi:flagellar motor switch protein FliN